MRYAIVFGLLAMLFGAYAVVLGSFAWLLLWPAIAFAVVASAYAINAPWLLGKQPSGRIAWWSLVVCLPYFLLTWSVWHLKRQSSEPACQEVLPRLWIGRRLLAREISGDIRHVVDLTSEFVEDDGVRTERDYRCWPILDGMSPSIEQLQEIAQWVDEREGAVFIHCAVGHGRTGLVAVAVLLRRRVAPDVRSALASLRTVRPTIQLNPAQRQCAERYARTLN